MNIHKKNIILYSVVCPYKGKTHKKLQCQKYNTEFIKKSSQVGFIILYVSSTILKEIYRKIFFQHLPIRY